MDEAKTRISTEAILEATGKTWNEWFLLLNTSCAYELDHKSIVALLESFVESIWWRQTIAVEYEKLHELRVTGETSDGTYQIGAQMSVPVSPKRAWELIVSLRGINAWLGEGAKPDPKKGDRYTTREGVSGEYRVVKTMSHLRLTWKPAGWEKASTLQLRVTPKGRDKAVISFHHEGLHSEQERNEMRTRWKQALEELATMATA